MFQKRTDLAVEAREIWREGAGETTKLPGVEAREKRIQDLSVETVKILDEEGEKALCKPKGVYITITLDGQDRFRRGCEALAEELRPLLPGDKRAPALVVGLGNRYVTPDNLGPMTLRNTIVTRHLVEAAVEYFGDFRPVSALEAGVSATTGVESAEMVRAVAEKVKPSVIIAVDALASRRLSRVCATIQLADTGITPGSGVGNARTELSQKTLGVPVIAIGVPTVVDAGTLAADLMEEAGLGNPDEKQLSELGGGVIVTPRDIDERVAELGKTIGYGISMALHDGMSIEGVTDFLS